MSFGVSRDEGRLEWAGTNLDTVFAQRRNMLSPKFWSMLADILRFNRRAKRYLLESEINGQSLGTLLRHERFGAPFCDWYLLPMAAAIWSAAPDSILEFPAATFLRFCLNHSLLQVANRPVWKTVLGGGREYVRRMCLSLHDVRLNTTVTRVRRSAQRVTLEHAGGESDFAAVVLATHAPDSLAMLADPSQQEREVLGKIRYQDNLAILHTDETLLPARRKVWSAWNYLCSGDQRRGDPVCVSYLLNRLQPLPFAQPVVLTLNPFRLPRQACEIARFKYAHPVLDQEAISAQRALPLIQGSGMTWHAGAWCGYGFHEDGLNSALRVAAAFDCLPDWARLD
jgi:predicted NAD/FAD-binding protein